MAPFPGVARHVKNAKTILAFQADRARPTMHLCVPFEHGRVVSKGIQSSRTCAVRELPLGFGRQTIGRLLLFAQPIAKGDSVIPSHHDHRMVVFLVKTEFFRPVSSLRLDKSVFS